MSRPWTVLFLLSLAVFLAYSLWLSASAVLPALTREWGPSDGGRAWMTMAVQLGFVAGALGSALLNLPDILATAATKPSPRKDLWTYQKIGQKGTEVTGYPAISVYHDFRYHPKEIISSVFDDWLYDHLGIFGWTVELWSPQRQAGLRDYKYIDWYREHLFAEDLQMLRWSDEALAGKEYVDWYPFDHPQLGRVELGGWNQLYAFRNPPPAFLEKEISPFPRWLVWHLLISPRLALHEASRAPLGEGAYRIRLVVQNSGWLPSYVTKKALEGKVVRGVVCEIELPDGAALETGSRGRSSANWRGARTRRHSRCDFPVPATPRRTG